MADLCVSVTNACSNGDHRDVTATIDGVSVTDRLHDGELLTPLTNDERLTLLRLTARVLRRSGVGIADFAGRVLRGDEATNVKQYNLVAPGAAVVKTNIGTAYVNVLPGANGERILVDVTACTQFRIFLAANLVGTGAFAARVIRDADSTVLFESTNLGAAGERDLDSGWQTLPQGFTGLEVLRLQAKSATASDDPVFRRCVLLVR